MQHWQISLTKNNPKQVQENRAYFKTIGEVVYLQLHKTAQTGHDESESPITKETLGKFLAQLLTTTHLLRED